MYCDKSHNSYFKSSFITVYSLVLIDIKLTTNKICHKGPVTSDFVVTKVGSIRIKT